MEIITGYTGQAHVTAEQDRDINIGIFGPASYVLSVGMCLKAEMSTNNEIKIRDGVAMHQGCACSIKKNTYDTVQIANGSQSMKRKDLIVLCYEKQPNSGVESAELKVIQGTPSPNNPLRPAHTEGDIQAGDILAEMPLYEVNLNGLSITGVVPIFQKHNNIFVQENEPAGVTKGTIWKALNKPEKAYDGQRWNIINPFIYPKAATAYATREVTSEAVHTIKYGSIANDSGNAENLISISRDNSENIIVNESGLYLVNWREYLEVETYPIDFYGGCEMWSQQSYNGSEFNVFIRALASYSEGIGGECSGVFKFLAGTQIRSKYYMKVPSLGSWTVSEKSYMQFVKIGELENV